MKRNIILQIITIAIVLTMWDFSHIRQQVLTNSFQDKLSALPLIVYLKSGMHEKIRGKLDNLALFRSIEFIEGNIIADSLMAEYHLEHSREALTAYPLPDVLQLYPDPLVFNSAAIDSVLIYLNRQEKVIENIQFNQIRWNSIQSEISNGEMLYKIYTGFYGFLTFLLAMLMIAIDRQSSEEYWRVFERAGGDIRIRRRRFIWQALILLLLSLSLSALFVFLYSKLVLNLSQVSIALLVLPVSHYLTPTGVLILALVLAVLFTRRQTR